MDFETATRIHREIAATSQITFVRDLNMAAVRYARFRTDWKLMSREEQREIDTARRMAHDVFIDSCNILCRAMAKSGEDTQWREQLGQDRATIGDLACYIHCFLGLQAR